MGSPARTVAIPAYKEAIEILRQNGKLRQAADRASAFPSLTCHGNRNELAHRGCRRALQAGQQRSRVGQNVVHAGGQVVRAGGRAGVRSIVRPFLGPLIEQRTGPPIRCSEKQRMSQRYNTIGRPPSRYSKRCDSACCSVRLSAS